MITQNRIKKWISKITLKQILSIIVLLLFLVLDTESEYKKQLNPIILVTEWLILMSKLFIIGIAVYRYYLIFRGELELPLELTPPVFSSSDLALPSSLSPLIK